MNEVITWVDKEGRYRVTSPAYDDPTNPTGETAAQCRARVWRKIRARYGLPANHPKHTVSDAAQRAAIVACCGQLYRWPVNGDANKRRDGRDGAWEMGADGTPTVNMPKARGIQMDRVRSVRDAELEKLDVPYMQALEAGDAAEQQRIAALKQQLRDIPQTFDIISFLTPATLQAAWPSQLPSPLTGEG